MGKKIGIVIILFCFLLVGVVALTMVQILLATGLTGPHGASAASPSGPGLMNIDFIVFQKGGKGWNDITQGYGVTPYSSIYPNDWHDGIDIAAAYGAPIYSPNNGIVVATGNQDDYCYHRAFGEYVAVRDPATGLILWYAHLGTIAVIPNQIIQKGTLIGDVGVSGLETGTHLHFSIFEAAGFTMTPRDGCGPEPTGKDLNPLQYLGTTYN